MADFQATLVNPVGGLVDITIDSTCATLTIVDHSNYDEAPPESGHDRPDFTDFRKVTVTDPNGVDFIHSSVTGDTTADAVIPAPSTGTDTITHTIIGGDGVHTVKLCAVPTYNAAATYEALTDFVFFSGTLYQSRVGSNTGNQPDVSPTEWLAVTEADLSTKYCTTERVIVKCAHNDCIDTKVHAAICLIKKHRCNDDEMCGNPEFIAAAKLMMIDHGIIVANATQDFEEAECLINLSKDICNCSEPTNEPCETC